VVVVVLVVVVVVVVAGDEFDEAARIARNPVHPSTSTAPTAIVRPRAVANSPRTRSQTRPVDGVPFPQRLPATARA
jgi:hypothetical protein